MRPLPLILCLLVCLGSTTVAQEKKEKKDPGRDAVHLKVFRLQLCDPDEVVSVLEQLLELPADMRFLGGPMGLGGPMPMPMLAPMPMLGPLPMIPMMPDSPPEPPQLRVISDIRSGAVIVRGREEDIQMAMEIISVLESPAGKPLPKTKLIEAIALTHAQASDISSMSDLLDLPIRVVGLNDLKMVIGVGADDTLRKWGAMVRDLDVPDRKLEMNKMRRLGVVGSGNRAGAM